VCKYIYLINQHLYGLIIDCVSLDFIKKSHIYYFDFSKLYKEKLSHILIHVAINLEKWLIVCTIQEAKKIQGNRTKE